jgi:hypothetical protein
METSTSSIIKTSTFSTIKINADEVANAKSRYDTLAEATRGGYFNPVTASETDIVAVEEKDDGTAIVVVVSEKTIVSNTMSSGS